MTPATFDKKKLNQVYLQLAKKYHPDMAQAKGSCDDCADKFKKIVAAHEILKDDHERRVWDIRHGVNGYGTSHSSAPPDGYPGYAYGQPHGASSWKGREYHGNTYRADPFDGFWNHEHQQNFNKNLNDSRVWLLKVVVGFVIFIAVCELVTVSEVSDRRIIELDRISWETEQLYARILANFDMGDSAEERIQRFLEHRKRTLDNYPDTSYSGMTGSRKKPN